MICLIDRRSRLKSTLNLLIKQFKYPGKYNECSCLNCSLKDKYTDVNDQGTCFADNDSDSVNDKGKYSFKDEYNGSVNDQGRDEVLGSPICFEQKDDNNDEDIYLRIRFIDQGSSYTNGGTRVISYLQRRYTNPRRGFTDEEIKISININGDLQSWSDDDDFLVNVIFPENFRCIKSGPSECGKTFLLKKLTICNVNFDKLYIIGSTGDQYEGVESYNGKANYEFIKDVKRLPFPDTKNAQYSIMLVPKN